MNFNEKLIDLRKKQGLSQEELGYKLNVTRQTVSKWELGQTTPEMDKLVEMSKLFNVSVDDLVNGTEINTNTNANTINNTNPINDNMFTENNNSSNDEAKKKKAIIIGIVVLVIVLMLGFGVVSMVRKTAMGIIGGVGSSIESVEGVFETTQKQNDSIWAIFLKVFGFIDDQIADMQESDKKFEVTKFNSLIQTHQGTQSKIHLLDLIDNIVTKNKTNDRKIVVVFDNKTLTENNDIIAIKTKLEDRQDYEVDLQYDEDGYIYKVDIMKVEDIGKNNTNEETNTSTDRNDFQNQVLDNINNIQNDVLNNQNTSEDIFNQVFDTMEQTIEKIN